MENLVAYDLSNLRGLVVDDSRFMRQVMAEVLREFGINDVLLAEDGGLAFEQFCRNQPDFVITDWDMDHQDGPSLVKSIRTDPRSPNAFAPVIMLTGFAEHSRVLEARDFGITEFMVKPISSGVVYKRLVSLIENPRPFVNSGTGYFGPCRRRLTLESYDGENRRMKAPEEIGASALNV
ncbi:MAG TPA: two-component system response regulator [Rhodospirillaceae bacterium]|nr:two-component system response regulator [Rhodospirillaceae bacterium]HAT36130.1 two-component system response regulator [Rhodospirillaceae bacterium]